MSGEAAEPASGGVPVHPPAAGVAQDRTGDSAVDRPVDRSPHGWRKRDEDDPGAFANDTVSAYDLMSRGGYGLTS